MKMDSLRAVSRCAGLVAVLLLVQWSLPAAAKLRIGEASSKPIDWYRSAEGLRVTTNILSWQSTEGSWPKNLDTVEKPFTGDAKKLQGTFDNGATTGELRFLARALRATGDPRCERAFLKGLDHILKAQYPTGGWPQFYPPSRQYHRHITFNDNAMVRLMQFLREIATSPDFAFVDAARRQAAQASFDRGIQCILRCQVLVNGKLTAWCAQHDEIDLSPRGARTYELPSLSGSESVGILQLLMSLDPPNPEVIRAVKAGAEWFNSARITGIRIEKQNGERVTVNDTNAPPLWARFYEIDTGRPIFSDRDGVKKYDFMQIGRERRNGYSWYGDWGAALAKDYAQWKAKWLKPDSASAAEPLRIVIIGDSTVCDYPTTNACRGWGQFIGDYFNDSVRFINLARSGRSTKTFIKEGLWAKALAEKPDFVLIQFGHNDSHDPAKPEATNASTDFKDNLRRYVDETRTAGATPVLITPMHRRTFGPDGQLSDILLPYATAMKEVATERKVAVIDLHASSGKLFQRTGEKQCALLASAPNDQTHFNENGARVMALLVWRELHTIDPRLKEAFKTSRE